VNNALTAYFRQRIDPLSPLQEERSALVISSRIVDGEPIVISRYRDDVWRILNQPTNKPPSEQAINFYRLPRAFQETMKAITYRYLQRGREGQKRPGPRAVVKLVRDAGPFLRYLEKRSIAKLANATAEICAGYVEACRRHRVSTSDGSKPMAVQALVHRFASVEALHELSQYTQDRMPEYPWPETSAAHLAGRTGPGTGLRKGGTPLMPDEVFTRLFQRASSIVESGASLLDVRDTWLIMEAERGQNWDYGTKCYELGCFVKSRGWRSAGDFNKALYELRTACYIIAASLSGCRNHELAFVQTGACYSTTSKIADREDDVQTFWWMRSQSTKTGADHTEWMIPKAAATALKVMERWASPYQQQIATEIDMRRARDRNDPEIAEALRHQAALFLAAEHRRGNQV